MRFGPRTYITHTLCASKWKFKLYRSVACETAHSKAPELHPPVKYGLTLIEDGLKMDIYIENIRLVSWMGNLKLEGILKWKAFYRIYM